MPNFQTPTHRNAEFSNTKRRIFKRKRRIFKRECRIFKRGPLENPCGSRAERTPQIYTNINKLYIQERVRAHAHPRAHARDPPKTSKRRTGSIQVEHVTAHQRNQGIKPLDHRNHLRHHTPPSYTFGDRPLAHRSHLIRQTPFLSIEDSSKTHRLAVPANLAMWNRWEYLPKGLPVTSPFGVGVRIDAWLCPAAGYWASPATHDWRMVRLSCFSALVMVSPYLVLM